MITKLRDNPKDWTADYTPALSFDVVSYQHELDKIAGKSRGHSILKLFWGGIETEQRYSKWANGVPIESTQEPKFYARKKHPLLLDFQKVPIRRWIIAQRTEPEQYGYGKEDTFTDEYGVVKPMVEKPREGYYDAYIYIGDHSLCPIDCSDKKLCFGDYKEPSLDELSLVLEHTFRLMQDKTTNPYKPLTAEDVERFGLEYKKEKQAKDEAYDKEFDERSFDWWKTHGHRITSDDPSVIKHGKYHDLGRK